MTGNALKRGFVGQPQRTIAVECVVHVQLSHCKKSIKTWKVRKI